MTKVYFVRHAEAEGNFYRIFQGQTNSGITENGEKQLDALSERFRDIPIDAIYASDLNRTMRTAEAVNRTKGFTIIKDEGLREINGGEWEGKTWDELPEKYPEAYYYWESKPHLARLPGGESMEEVRDRMIKTIKKIVLQNPDKRIAIVTHGTALRCFTCYAKHLPFEKIGEIDWYDNTAIIETDFDEKGEVIEMKDGDSSHLPPELSTFTAQSWWKEIKQKKDMEETAE